MNFTHTVETTFKTIIENADTYRNLLYQHKLLVLKGLVGLTPLQHWQIHACFGTPWTDVDYKDSFEVASLIEEGKWITNYSNQNTKKRIGDKSLPWHHDIPWHRLKRYPIRSLYPTQLDGPASSQVPTIFCDADAAWNRMPKDEWEKLAQADVRLQYWYDAAKGIKDVPTRVIPLVERHPHTKKYSVLLNSFGYDRPDLKHSTTSTGAWIIDCWSRSEHLGLEYINHLHDLVVTPDNIYSHHWEMGDLVLFDNASGVMHGRTYISDPNVVRSFWRINVKHYWQE